jgi:HK97 family phage prohead protease
MSDNKQILTRSGVIHRNTDGKGRTRTFVISTEGIDRHNTAIMANAWDLSRFGGIGFYQHRTWSNDPDDMLGPAKVSRDGSDLVGSIEFEEADINPKAEKILKKIDNGTISAVSVGFIPHDGEWRGEGDKRHFVFTKAELTEFSVVGIPSNPDAKIRAFEEAIKSLSPSEEANDMASDEERAQLYKRKFLVQNK